MIDQPADLILELRWRPAVKAWRIDCYDMRGGEQRRVTTVMCGNSMPIDDTVACMITELVSQRLWQLLPF